jgi:uncharacterized protein YjiS (DUF1127 family)
MLILHNCTAAFELFFVISASYFMANDDCADAILRRTKITRSDMLLSSLIRMIRSWRRFNASLRELNAMGDRELADIGISRSDIPRVAWDAAER